MKSFLTFLSIIFVLSGNFTLVRANGTNEKSSFNTINGKICAISEPTFCIPEDEVTTFKTFKKGKIILGPYATNVYVSKKAIYIFPRNDEWRRIELNTEKLKRLNASHFTDGTSYFYNGLNSLRPIVKIGTITEGKLRLFTYGVSALGKKLFYHGTELKGFDPDKLSVSRHRITEYGNTINFSLLWHESILLLEDTAGFYKIDGVDRASFRVVDSSTFEDKYKKYSIEDGPYDVENVEIINK